MVERYRINLRLNCVENHPTGNYVTHVDYAAVEADHAEALARLDDAELMLRAMVHDARDGNHWHVQPMILPPDYHYIGHGAVDAWEWSDPADESHYVPRTTATPEISDEVRAAMLADTGGE